MIKKNIYSNDAVWIFLLAFLYAYNASYINGDDVEHLRRNIFGFQYMPYQFPGWIPNRLFDQYGRAIASLSIDQLYYLLINFRLDAFIIAYKIISSILYTGVILFSYRLISFHAGINDLKNASDIYLFKIFIFSSLLCVLPYVNQVHMICYQLPTLLAYYLMVELAFAETNQKSMGATRYLLIYICAFTLESISLIFLMYSTFKLVQSFFQKKKLENFWEYVFAFVINAVSLAIAAFYSQRIEVAKGYLGLNKYDVVSEFREIFPFFKTNSGLLILFCIIFTISITLFQRRNESLIEIKVIKKHTTPTLLTLLAVYIISIRSGHNYFSASEYPWGDLYLISKIGVLTLFIYLINRIVVAGGLASNVVTLLIFIITSALVVQCSVSFDGKSRMAYSVTQIWSQISSSEVREIVVTEFNSDAIPMQLRPLPSQSSPLWFNDGYQFLFKKYLNTKSPVIIVYN